MKYSMFTVLILAVTALGYTGLARWQSFGGGPGTIPEIVLHQSDGGSMVAEVNIPGFWLKQYPAGGAAHDRIELPGSYPLGEVGSPETPAFARMFALPFGTGPEVTILSVDFVTYPGISLLPRQTPQFDSPMPPDGFRINNDVYSSDSFFPAQWVEADDFGIWGGLNTGRFVFNPFRYNPVTGELQAVSSITFRVDFHGDAQAMAYPSSPAVVSSASRHLVNFAGFRESASAPIDAGGAEYVFVVHENHYDAVMPLVEFYHSIGYETVVETLSGSVSAGQIKAAITDNYDTAATRFALIAGTHAEMPSYNYGGHVGDYWYACLVGNDLIPEIAVGRLTGTTAQISHQVDKVIAGYYQYSFDDRLTTGIVPSTTVLAAHGENYPGKYTQCCNEIAAYDYGLCDKTFYKIYPPEGGTNAMVQEWFNNGIGTVGYRGHGMHTTWTWSAPGYWTKSHVDELTNTFMPPVFNIACYCGNYANYAECLSESFQWATGGSSGNLGATNPSYTIPNHDYMKEIYKNLYDVGLFHVGESIMDATVFIINFHGSLGEANAKMYIWFGDAAMELFTNDVANPRPLAIATPANFGFGNQTISVTVTSDGSPVQNAIATLTDGIDGTSHGMTFHETALTNSSGQASFTVNIPSGTPMLYTGARRQNYNPITGTIGGVGIEEEASAGIPPAVHSIAASPNPVSGTAVVNFSLPQAGAATIAVYDVAGRRVDTIHSGELGTGAHSVNWNASGFANGVYFMRLSSPAGTLSTQIMVLK